MRPQVVHRLVLSLLPANAKRTTCYFHGSCNPTVALFLGIIAITPSNTSKKSLPCGFPTENCSWKTQNSLCYFYVGNVYNNKMGCRDSSASEVCFARVRSWGHLEPVVESWAKLPNTRQTLAFICNLFGYFFVLLIFILCFSVVFLILFKREKTWCQVDKEVRRVEGG